MGTRLPTLSRGNYLSCFVYSDYGHDTLYIIDKALSQCLEDGIYSPELIQWYMQSAKMSIRRQKVAQALKYIETSAKPPSTKGSAHYPVNLNSQTWHTVGCSSDCSNDEVEEELQGSEEILEYFTRWEKKQPCIPFFFIVRLCRYMPSGISTLYHAPFAIATTSTPKKLHILIDALILSGFLTFTILPAEHGDNSIDLFPMGMLIWHYLANRAGLIPDFDLEGVQKMIDMDDKAKENNQKIPSHHPDSLPRHVPQLSNAHGMNRQGWDRYDPYIMTQHPLIHKLYNTFVTKFVIDNDYEQQTINNDLIMGEFFLPYNQAHKKLDYDHTLHCYLIYQILQTCVESSSIGITLDHLTTLLSRPTPNQQQGSSVNNNNNDAGSNNDDFAKRIAKWCLHQLCTAYGSIAQAKKAICSVVNSLHEKQYDDDDGSFFDRLYFNNIYSLCFVLDIFEIIQNCANSKQQPFDDNDNYIFYIKHKDAPQDSNVYNQFVEEDDYAETIEFQKSDGELSFEDDDGND